MARPTKKGLDYFPLDVDFLSDLKVRRIIKACGKEAVHILVALLANIYRDEGYYVLWDDDLAFLVADEVGTKEGTVEELVRKAVQVKFFDKDIFDKYSVLTSKGIQNRYILATKERKKVELEFKYLLTNEVNRSNISINGRNNSVNQGNNQQSKVKESKEKESKEKQSKEIGSPAVAFQKTLTVYQQNIGVLNPFVQQNIEYRINDFVNQGTNEIEANEIVRLAIEKAALSNKLSWNYADGILKNWLDHSLFTLSNVKAEQKPKSKNEPYSVDESDKLPY